MSGRVLTEAVLVSIVTCSAGCTGSACEYDLPRVIAALRAARALLADIEDWDYGRRAQLPRRITQQFDAALGRKP